MATVNIYDMADTWNDGGTTFTAIKMNVTDTASASGSLLMDLQVGGASKFSVDSAGNIDFPGTDTRDITTNSGGGGRGKIRLTSANTIGIEGNPLICNQYFGLTSGFTTSADLYLSRKDAANLRLGAADNATSIVAQTLSVQSVASGGATPNIVGEDFTIQGSAGTGSGAGGSIIFQVAPAGGSGTGQNTPVDAFRITSARNFEFIGAAPSKLTFVGESIIARNTANTADRALLSQYGIRAGSNVHIGFSDSTTSLSSMDTLLWRDAANTLALRNGANAQEFRVYKTTTGTVYKALLGDNNLIKISGEAFTDGAGANTATLANAPAAGDPTKWIPIDDNGTTRYIPAW